MGSAHWVECLYKATPGSSLAWLGDEACQNLWPQTGARGLGSATYSLTKERRPTWSCHSMACMVRARAWRCMVGSSGGHFAGGALAPEVWGRGCLAVSGAGPTCRLESVLDKQTFARVK